MKLFYLSCGFLVVMSAYGMNEIQEAFERKIKWKDVDTGEIGYKRVQDSRARDYWDAHANAPTRIGPYNKFLIPRSKQVEFKDFFAKTDKAAEELELLHRFAQCIQNEKYCSEVNNNEMRVMCQWPDSIRTIACEYARINPLALRQKNSSNEGPSCSIQ